MKRQDVLDVLVTAAGTAALTIMLLAPKGVGADDAAPRIKPVIAEPQFTSAGCLFVLSTDKPEYQAGDKPSVQLKATNPTGKPAETTVLVSISTSSPVRPESRMMPISKVLWHQKYLVRLAPGEVKTLSAVADKPLPARQEISITMGDERQVILAKSPGVKSVPVAAARSVGSEKAASNLGAALRWYRNFASFWVS